MLATKGPGPAVSVLVVDDDRDTAESTAQVLAMTFGRCTVRAATGGAEALRSASADAPDVVLADLKMPGMSGYELARRLSDGGARPPVLIAVSGCGSADEVRRATEAGFQLHLTKPVEPAVLVGTVRRVADFLGRLD